MKRLAIGFLCITMPLTALGGSWFVYALSTGQFSEQHTAQQIADKKMADIAPGFECTHKATVVDGQRFRFVYQNADKQRVDIYVDRGAIADRDIVRFP